MKRLALVVVAALLALGSAAFARESLGAVDELAAGRLAPSAIPALLGPIDELGRNGWQCFPERAASATQARRAELPTEDTH